MVFEGIALYIVSNEAVRMAHFDRLIVALL